MTEYLKDKKKVALFQKPMTLATSIKPDTTNLSPYLKFFYIIKIWLFKFKIVILQNYGYL
jgi:hypothetical protein